MRSTVDLPPGVHRRAVALARERGQSLSSLLAELTARGLGTLGEPIEISRDARTGFPVVRIGHPVSSADVAAALDDE